MSLSVNGSSLNVNDEGEAVWKTLANDVGTKKYNAVATVTNPVTGKTDTYKREFEFEVGERSCNVSAEKMNVFYIGVENPVGITAAGVPSAQLSVQASGGGIDLVKQGGGKYVANVKSPGEATIVLSGGGLPPTNFKFRVKRIPTPVPMLSDKRGGAMPNGVFKAQQGVIPVLEGFEFDAKCTIQGFNLVRVAPRQDAQIVANTGGRFSPQANTLIQQAKPGDRYLFEQIKGRCPGDAAARDLGDMSFQIK